eukprot:7153046-Karenia_brevis.AAC.1
MPPAAAIAPPLALVPAPPLPVVPAGGGGPVGAVGVPILPVGGRLGVAGVGGTWVLDEPTGSFDVGLVVALPPGAQVLGSRALVSLENEPVVLKHLDQGVGLDEHAHARS